MIYSLLQIEKIIPKYANPKIPNRICEDEGNPE
jgi:hypothetical protein